MNERTRERLARGAGADTKPWWQRGVIYQIYPRSFQDSNGDGIGDLRGIIDRLDYLVWLGIEAIWISPIFSSPMADFGYDISDYKNIDLRFGTLNDFDRLLLEAHRRGLRVLLDFVPNHTSDRHPWFQEALKSRENPFRDFYIWRDPAPDGVPPKDGSVLAYLRETEEERLFVALNLGPEQAELEVPGPCRALITTTGLGEGERIDGRLKLRGNEGVLAQMTE